MNFFVCSQAPPSVYWDRDDEADSHSSSGSCLSEVYSLPEFLPVEENSSQLVESPSNLPMSGPAWRLQRAQSSKSMHHMEQWLSQQLQRRCLAIPKQLISRPTNIADLTEAPLALEYKNTASDARAFSFDGTGSFTYRQSSSLFTPAPKHQLMLLPAPVFLTEALSIGHYCERGSRSTNEDTAFGILLPNDPFTSHVSQFQQAVCCGVFDGHGGVEVAAHLTEFLPDLVLQRCCHIKHEGVKEVCFICD